MLSDPLANPSPIPVVARQPDRRTAAAKRERGEMNNKPVYLTAEGLAKLKAELIHLITVERPRAGWGMGSCGRVADRRQGPVG